MPQPQESTRSGTALIVRGIDFSYGRLQVLFDLGFDVTAGETLALLGANGAGKTTILRVVTGLERPQRGSVRLGGVDITSARAHRRAAMGIHMLPGGRGVFRSMTVQDNLEIAGYLYRRSPSEVSRRITGALEAFPVLKSRLGDLAGELSGGQQQILALARVLMHEPEILMIDELSLGLAPIVVEELLASIHTLKEAGQTMVIVEQSVNLALAIADRAVFIEKGRLRFEGNASELAGRDDLARTVFFSNQGQ